MSSPDHPVTENPMAAPTRAHDDTVQSYEVNPVKSSVLVQTTETFDSVRNSPREAMLLPSIITKVNVPAHDNELTKAFVDSSLSELPELPELPTEPAKSEMSYGTRKNSSITRSATRMVRSLFCCGVPYQAPSEEDISVTRNISAI